MEQENIKHAIIAILIGAAVQILVQLLQLGVQVVSSWIPHISGAAAGASAYLYQWKTCNLG